MNELKPHQQRVVTEKADLDEKIMKLDAFTKAELFKTVDPAEQKRLRRQLVIMRMYRDVLGARIKAFEQPSTDKSKP